MLAMRRQRPHPITCPTCAGKGKLWRFTNAELRALRESAAPPVSLRAMARRLSVSASYLSEVERGGKAVTQAISNAYSEIAARQQSAKSGT